jgi:uncharacterized protein YaaQ
MKLIVAVIQDDCRDLITQLTDDGFQVTEFSSIGAFFRRQSTTLMISSEAERIDEALATVRRMAASAPDDDAHRATIFVLRTGQFIAL